MKAAYRVAVAALVAIGLGLLAVPAYAQSGGAGAPGPPVVTTVACLPSAGTPCAAPSKLLRGRQFAVRGKNLDLITKVVFRGGRRRSDDAVARVTRARGRYAVALVPPRARSGPLVLVDRYGAQVATARPVRVGRAPKTAPVDIAPATRFFYDGRRRPTFAFDAGSAGQAQVNLVSQEAGAVVRTWSVSVEAGQHVELTWDGRGAQGVERAGSYRFDLVGEASIATAAPDSDQDFFFADHVFPIRGRHNLGYTKTNNFGGARRHKGQDMFARCGTRLAAARGGLVQYAGYHGAAGNYLVIDGAGTDVDYVYMHMRAPALVSTGERVFTGQKVGEVGDTGRATGCHLHFEMWSGPGWYEGGRAFDPLPALGEWDGYS